MSVSGSGILKIREYGPAYHSGAGALKTLWLLQCVAKYAAESRNMMLCIAVYRKRHRVVVGGMP